MSKYKNQKETWYEIKDDMIYFSDELIRESEELFSPIHCDELITRLNELNYNVVCYKKLYYRVLNKQVSSVQFNTEIEAYLDCYEHYWQNN